MVATWYLRGIASSQSACFSGLRAYMLIDFLGFFANLSYHFDCPLEPHGVGFMMGTPDAHSCRRLERHQYSDIYERD